MTAQQKNTYTGIAVALATVLIWSGNYVVARGIAKQLPPISLAFYRWSLATVSIFPFAIKSFIKQRQVLLSHKAYLFWTALTGIAIFNSFIYLAGHYTSAINLALIGTSTAPVFVILLSVIFLKEKVGWYRIAGIIICIAGIFFLLSQGSLQKLANLYFGIGDILVLISAFAFSVYSILVRQKPSGISPVVFLFVIFITGTLLLLPFYMYEHLHAAKSTRWNLNMIMVIIYLGIGNSIIGFLGWNAAIQKLGASTTALFANLIPVFSTIEAVFFLGEQFTIIHLISGILVIGGVIIANIHPPAANPL